MTAFFSPAKMPLSGETPAASTRDNLFRRSWRRLWLGCSHCHSQILELSHQLVYGLLHWHRVLVRLVRRTFDRANATSREVRCQCRLDILQVLHEGFERFAGLRVVRFDIGEPLHHLLFSGSAA